MDNRSKPDNRQVNLTANDLSLLESRIIEACKHIDEDFTADTEKIRQNVNFLFNANYSIEQILYVLGSIYEKQFFYRHETNY